MSENKGRWPTLRNVVLRDPDLVAEALSNNGRITMTATGTHIVHESPTGGIVAGGKPTIYPSVSCEWRFYVDGKPLYLICWIGYYAKGAVFHCGWQFPHSLHAGVEMLASSAKHAYRCMVEILYNSVDPDEWDADVRKFLEGK